MTTVIPGPRPGVVYAENFVDPSSTNDLEFQLVHFRDNPRRRSWMGDHAPITGQDPDACTDPFTKRTITQGEQPTFNDDWHYRCAPGDDTSKAHLMTALGDVAGFSSGAFSPKGSFTDVTEVRWSVNITDLGFRQWTDVAIVPGTRLRTPCTVEFTGCLSINPFNDVLGSVATSFFALIPAIHNGDTMVQDVSWRDLIAPNDPALTDIRPRRRHFFRDNGNGTLTFGIEKPNGSFHRHTVRGAFPKGEVRVVFVDNNYEPSRDDAGNPKTFTWHWDDLAVLAKRRNER